MTLTPGRANVLRLTAAGLNSLSELSFRNQPGASTPFVVVVTGAVGDWHTPNTPGVSGPQAPYMLWDFPDATGITITGGRAPEYLRYDNDLIRITKALFAANKPVASVCHGIEILAAADVIRGREVTTVAKCALDCTFSGGTYVNRERVDVGALNDGDEIQVGRFHLAFHVGDA